MIYFDISVDSAKVYLHWRVFLCTLTILCHGAHLHLCDVLRMFIYTTLPVAEISHHWYI